MVKLFSHLDKNILSGITVTVLQVFAESQDYGSHGERVRNACWGYLCQSGAQELKEVNVNLIIL